jgi:hypothetical protein
MKPSSKVLAFFTLTEPLLNRDHFWLWVIHQGTGLEGETVPHPTENRYIMI